MGLIYVVWGLFLVLMPVASFLNVCWSLYSWQGMCKCNSWFLVLGFSEAVAAQACPQNTWYHSWSLQGQRQKLTTSHCWQAAAVAHDHPWGLCRQCPAICEHVQREKATVQVLPLPNASLKQWQLATKATSISFSYTLSCSHTGFQPP